MTDENKPEDNDDTAEQEPVVDNEYYSPSLESDDDEDTPFFSPGAYAEEDEGSKTRKKWLLAGGALFLSVILVLAMLAVVGAITGGGKSNAAPAPAATTPAPTPTAVPSPVKTVTVTAKPSKSPESKKPQFGNQFANTKELIDELDPLCEWQEVGTYQLCAEEGWAAQVGGISEFMAVAVDNPDFNGSRYLRGENWIIITRYGADTTLLRVRLGGTVGTIGVN